MILCFTLMNQKTEHFQAANFHHIDLWVPTRNFTEIEKFIAKYISDNSSNSEY